MIKLSRNALVLKYFTQHGQSVGRTRLIKLAYLADLHARELLGHPITQFKYRWWPRGPFDQCFYDATNELVDQGLATESEVHYPTGQVGKPLCDTGQSIAFDWSAAEAHVLAYVVEKYMNTELSSLLEDIVYKTEPMQKIQETGKRDDTVPMELMNNRLKDKFGFDIEGILTGEQEVEAGQYKLATEFFDELRAKIVGESAG